VPGQPAKQVVTASPGDLADRHDREIARTTPVSPGWGTARQSLAVPTATILARHATEGRSARLVGSFLRGPCLVAGEPKRPEASMTNRFTSIIDVHVILRRAGRVLLLRRAGDVYAGGQLCLPSVHLVSRLSELLLSDLLLAVWWLVAGAEEVCGSLAERWVVPGRRVDPPLVRSRCNARDALPHGLSGQHGRHGKEPSFEVRCRAVKPAPAMTRSSWESCWRGIRRFALARSG
jgi:hypothetical protein